MMLREGSRLELEFALKLRDSTLAEMMATSRWVLTSLALLNSGGAVALLGMEQPGPFKAWAGGLFVTGILLALLTGQLSNHALKRLLPKIAESAGYWLSVVVDGERDEDLEKKLTKETQHLAKTGTRWARMAGYASLACFAVASGIVLANAL